MPAVSDDDDDELQIGAPIAPPTRKRPITATMLDAWVTAQRDEPVAEPAGESVAAKSRIVHCAAKDVRMEVEALRAAGFRDVRAFPLNVSTRSSASSASTTVDVYELRGATLESLRPAANIDVREDDEWLPGHAETMSIVSTALDIADVICSSKTTAAVIFSTKGGDAARTLACCARAALRKIDKKKATIALKGKAPAPKNPKLKAFVSEFEGCSRADILRKIEKFYMSEF